MFRLAEPQWLWLLTALLGFPPVWWWLDLWAQARLRSFVGSRLAAGLTAENSTHKKWIGRICVLLAVIFLILGLARPQAGLRGVRDEWRGAEIELLVDTSRSMLAQDVFPTRLGRAKQAMHYLVDHWEEQRVGLIPYAGTAFEVCPLTEDTGALKLLIDALDTEQLPVPGTDIGAALTEALQAFARTSRNSRAQRICVVVGDGESFGNLPKEALAKAVNEGLHIYTLGVGTTQGVPVPSKNTGEPIAPNAPRTRLNEKKLGELAALGQGLFVHLTGQGQEEEVVVKEIDRLEKVQQYSNRLLVWNDLYPFCAVAALGLLLWDSLLSRRKPRGKREVHRKRRAFVGLFLLAISSLSWVSPAQAGSRERIGEGLSAFQQRRWADAEKCFKQAAQKNPEDPLATYNYGCSLLVQKKFPEAYTAFVQAKAHAEGVLEQDVWYNVGYTAYYLGWRQGDPARWVEAAEAFQQVLLWNAGDDDAGYNLELILRQIEKYTKQTTQRQTQSQGGKQGDREGGGANLPGSDRSPSEGKSNEKAPPSEQNSESNQRQKSGDKSSVSEDQKGNKQKGMSKQDALRTLRSLENEEQDMRRNQQPNLQDENLYHGPDW
ncbi:MAG: VWA domain-containing protein [Candidatus Firestonebacteria bacterium]|nr:VWA domain-containing protein [Candidatus Firestonebacteria bacterium]